MSQRVRGNSKQTPVIKDKFYPCQPEDVSRVLGLIKNDSELVQGILEVPVVETDPHGPKVKREGNYPIFKYLAEHQFSEPTFNRTDNYGSYMGYLRKYGVFKYNDIKTSLWGIRIGYETIRLTVCYNDGVLGLCLRFATGKMKEVNDLESYKSMYQGRE
jgi:hypothetical protein